MCMLPQSVYMGLCSFRTSRNRQPWKLKCTALVSLCLLPSLMDAVSTLCTGTFGPQLMEKQLSTLHYLNKFKLMQREKYFKKHTVKKEAAAIFRRSPPCQERKYMKYRLLLFSAPKSHGVPSVIAHSRLSEGHQASARCGLSHPKAILNHSLPSLIFHNLLSASRLLDLNS